MSCGLRTDCNTVTVSPTSLVAASKDGPPLSLAAGRLV
jgi:hypothetical protein